MNIKIDERHIDGITVLDIVGKLTIDEAAQQLRDKINSRIAQKETRIVLNLQHVPDIDSGGLGALIASFGSVTRAGGTMKLLNVSARNHDLLSITRLVTVFESFDSEVEAVSSFEKAVPAALAWRLSHASLFSLSSRRESNRIASTVVGANRRGASLSHPVQPEGDVDRILRRL